MTKKEAKYNAFLALILGCGSGKYLGINPTIFNIGSDRCSALAGIAREKEHEVMLCDNLALPYRDESIDGKFLLHKRYCTTIFMTVALNIL